MSPNPIFICYANDAHLRAEQFAGTTAVFVLGRVNCIQDAWQRVRDRGSEIWKYEISISRPDSAICAEDELVYMGGSAATPLWPYLDASGQRRSQSTYSKLTDIRVSSPYVSYYIDHVATVIRSRRYSGLFLDGFGAQLFGGADWNNWPPSERQEWTAGAVDFARRLDEMRRAEDPSFLLVGNNHWDTATIAEKYVDGVVSENHPITNAAMVRIVGKTTYSPLGQRRVFTLSNTKASALQWAAVPGVTHVGCNEDNMAVGDSKYAYPTTPVVGYSRIGSAVDSAQLAQVTAQRDQALFELAIALNDCTAATQALAAAEASTAAAISERDALQAQLAESEQRLAAARNAWSTLAGLAA